MKYEHRVGARLIAFIIDMIIMGLLLSLASLLFGLGHYEQTVFGTTTIVYTYWEYSLIYALYYVFFAVAYNGKTLGKMALKLSVRQGNLETVPRQTLIIREVVKVLLMPISFIEFLFVLFRQDHKSIHDILTDTITLGTFNPNRSFYDPDEFKTYKEDKKNRKYDVFEDGYVEEDATDKQEDDDDYYM